ncbi:MAG: YbaK/EbsC family protein [Anaerolineaceae bacterium]|nr:YbaK/EbsC family protein [Anaerolineaceae bacterium]
MTTHFKKSLQRVQDALNESGYAYTVQELAASTRTAQEAADAVGCTLAQIVKSLIFEGEESGNPILVLASGANRVNEKTLAKLAGEPIRRAHPNFVRQRTGFAVGGVPPLGHSEPLQPFIDEDLHQFDEIWAAAGTPHAVFCLKSVDLQPLTGGKVVSIK